MSVAKVERRQLTRFGIIGLANNFALYLLFLLFLRMSVGPLWAAGICYCLGVCASYILNRTWTFESRDTHREDMPKFLVAHGVGVCSTIFVLDFLLGWLPPEVAQIINVGITAMVIYLSLTVLGFGGRRAD